MGNFVFNVAKGRVNELATLPGTNDALVAVVVEATGLETDAVLKDYDDLAALLAGASNEQTTMGRKTVAGIVVAVDDTGDRRWVDATDIEWDPASGNPTGKLLVCYDADTTGGTDANIVPLCGYDFASTPGGGKITAQVNALGLFEAV